MEDYVQISGLVTTEKRQAPRQETATVQRQDSKQSIANLITSTEFFKYENIKFGFLGEFQDPVLQKKFISHCMARKSTYFFAIIGTVIALWGGAESLTNMIVVDEQEALNDVIFTVLTLIFMTIALITGYTLVFNMIYEDYDQGILAKDFYGLDHPNCQAIFIISLHIILWLKLIRHITEGSTDHCLPHNWYSTLHDATFVPKGSSLWRAPECPRSAGVASFTSLELLIIMSITPILLMIIMNEPRLYLCFGCILLIELTIILTSETVKLLFELVKLFILLAVFYQLQDRRMHDFLNYSSLEGMLEQREKNADAQHALEMKHMIGNVAHDLKTVNFFPFLFFL
jgi:hypothetical protein